MPRQKFHQIYTALKERIESGVYPVGQLLPSENTLVREYGCSRNTVRRAIAELTADGNVRPCLFSDAEYSVREALRRGDDMQVLSIWRDAVAHKPQEHAIIEGTQRFMSQIGG